MKSFSRQANRKKLYLILATAGDIESFENFGFLERFKKQIKYYSHSFSVEILSSDKKDYSDYLGVRHRISPVMIHKPIIKQVLYFFFQILVSLKFKDGVIRVFGISNPALPFVKLLSVEDHQYP